MSEIRGNVDIVGITNLLQMFAMSGCEGYFSMTRGAQSKVIEFRSTGIRLLRGTRETNPLGEILVRSGRITREQLETLLADQKGTNKPLGELVAERDILPREVITSALREQVAEEIYDLFTWTGAMFLFSDGKGEAPPESEGPLAAIVLSNSMVTIMLEAVRRIDELGQIRQVITDDKIVPMRLELPAHLDDPVLDRYAIEDILPLVDGKRSIEKIFEESLFPKFTVLRTLYGLALRGVIKIRTYGDNQDPTTVVIRIARPTGKGASNGRAVLILSELPTYRAALGAVLRQAGFDSVEARGANEAIETVRKRKIDAILLDVSIETENGLTLCKRVRNSGDIPFIVLADNTSRQAISHAMSSGARYVLLKPFLEDLLLERLASVMDGGIPLPN